MYLDCRTKLDIAFILGQLSRHSSNPQVGYLHIAKQILQYLKGTSFTEIVWERDSVGHWDNKNQTYGTLRIIGYVDSSYVRDVDDWKSITRYCFFFAGVIITWYSK